jgi:hypothetical protein
MMWRLISLVPPKIRWIRANLEDPGDQVFRRYP